MRLLAACSLGGTGHLNPLMPFLVAAGRQRIETLVVGPAGLRAMVERAGYQFQVGGEPPESVIGPIRERLPRVSSNEATVLGNRELFGRLATTAMLPAMKQAIVEFDPDLVLRDPTEYASAVVAHRMGIPTAQIAISLAEAEAGSIRAAAQALETHRAGLVEELWASPSLSRFPASLDPSPFPTTIRYREPPGPAVDPLPDWWGGSGSPLIYVSFGTVVGATSAAPPVYRSALRAVQDLDARVLLTIGHRLDSSVLGDIPANVHVQPWVDQERVLPETALVVCHGGSGTVFGALAAGIPLVVVPFFGDQFENGRRVADAWAALMVANDPLAATELRRPLTEDDAPRISAAIATVLSEGSYRSSAQRIAGEMASAPTTDEVLSLLLQEQA